ncbi:MULTISPECIES: ABC transporter ATP-binding protein [Kordiimonas]|uniref:ABC transporter ATP-binding protein n=1 Tax=Kordiimonas TaxID=288021 RepID=UPI001FF16AD3|nr:MULTISPECIES: ABC transporter ATP-binding protein [Kordiimonas]MCK0068945.1 ABC transporter ATP-binding protein [Kordiimonas laminariae]
MTDYCIETDALTKCYGKKTALNDFSLKVQKGGIHAIVGSNGAGKSTLFRLLLGMIAPTSGSAKVLGVDSQNLTTDVRGKVGYVNEEHTLPVWMTAKAATHMQRSFYPLWDQKIYDHVIGYFDVDPNQKISGLSRGERAGLNLSMALAQSPEILILDEPTLGLDVVAKQSFLEALMFTETERAATIIYCSHQMEEIERVADQLIIMEKGHLKNNSAPHEFVERVSVWAAEVNGKPIDRSQIPGLLNIKRIDDQHHIMVTDQGDDFPEKVKHLGLTDLQSMPVNLERAVNAFLSKNHNSPDSKIG